MRTPVQVAYKALGEDFTHSSSIEAQEGFTCVRCQNTLLPGEVGVPLLKLISNKFTDWEHLTEVSASAVVCLPCSWAYSVLDNRLRRILITKDQVYLLSSLSASRFLMGSHKKLESASIVVPVSGKKHVLPYAKWGSLSYDDGSFKWSSDFSRSVTAVHFLKKSGVSETSLKNRSHYYPPAADAGLFFQAWKQFESINPTLLDLVLVLSRLLDDNILTGFFEGWAR